MGIMRALQAASTPLTKDAFKCTASELLRAMMIRRGEKPADNIEGWYQKFRTRNQKFLALRRPNNLNEAKVWPPVADQATGLAGEGNKLTGSGTAIDRCNG